MRFRTLHSSNKEQCIDPKANPKTQKPLRPLEHLGSRRGRLWPPRAQQSFSRGSEASKSQRCIGEWGMRFAGPSSGGGEICLFGQDRDSQGRGRSSLGRRGRFAARAHTCLNSTRCHAKVQLLSNPVSRRGRLLIISGTRFQGTTDARDSDCPTSPDEDIFEIECWLL